MLDRRIPVFVSVGRHYRPEEVVLVERISSALRAMGVDTLLLPRPRWDTHTPLHAIAGLMSQCKGVVVIAFTRMRYEEGYEWPDSPYETAIGSRYVATVWLDIEAALGFAFGLPTLVLADRRLRPEGLLNPKHQEYRAVEYDIQECQDGLPDYLTDALRAFATKLIDRSV